MFRINVFDKYLGLSRLFILVKCWFRSIGGSSVHTLRSTLAVIILEYLLPLGGHLPSLEVSILRLPLFARLYPFGSWNCDSMGMEAQEVPKRG